MSDHAEAATAFGAVAHAYHRGRPEIPAEIVRVLTPKGRFAAVSLQPDTRIPWVRKLGRVMEGKSVQNPPERQDPIEAVELSTRFGFVERTSHPFWQVIDRESVLDLALTHPAVVQLEPQKREKRLQEVRELYDDYGRGMDGMQLPLQAVCLRTTVLKKAAPPVGPPVDRPGGPGPEPSAERDDTGSIYRTFSEEIEATNPRGPRVDPPDDTGDDLLIDFR